MFIFPGRETLPPFRAGPRAGDRPQGYPHSREKQQRRVAAHPSLHAAIGAAGLGWAGLGGGAGRGAAQSAGRQQVAALRTELRAPLRTASPRRLAEAPAAAKTPRAVLRVKNGAAKLAKPPAAAAGEAPGGAPGSGLFMERSQSRLSLSASFEALAIYFPCMNSFDEEDAGTGGLRGGGRRVWGGEAAGSALREGCAGPGLRGSPGGGRGTACGAADTAAVVVCGVPTGPSWPRPHGAAPTVCVGLRAASVPVRE